jgi:hypothetical protein
MADDITFYDAIEGYCGRLSYRHGGSVALHVSTKSPTFDVTISRWGAVKEEVWALDGVPGKSTPPPTEADSQGCGWPVSVELEVDPGWRSGFYLVTMTASEAPAGRDVAHAGFVLRPTEPQQPALLVLSTNTWNAYNTWGGCSLYTGGSEVSFRRPFARGFLNRPEVERDDRKARPTRWGEEPDTDGLIYQKYRMDNGYSAGIGSSGWFTFERRFVEWAEANGYEFDYAISTDLEESSGLDGYDTMISVGHDEYVSRPQRRTMESHVARGGNLVSLSGNSMFWQVRIQEAGAPGRHNDGDSQAVMVGHKYSAHETDPVVTAGSPELMTGMWCDPLVGEPEWSLLGSGSAFGLYHRFGKAIAQGSGGFTIYRNDHWLFEGTGLGYGDLLGAKHGVVGYETMGCRLTFDEFQQPVPQEVSGLPDEIEIVAFAPSSSLGVGDYPASISALNDQGDLEFVASRYYGDLSEHSKAQVRHGNAVMLTCRPYSNGGEVVTVGSTDWTFGLADDPAVAQVTKNILDHFGL